MTSPRPSSRGGGVTHHCELVPTILFILLTAVWYSRYREGLAARCRFKSVMHPLETSSGFGGQPDRREPFQLERPRPRRAGRWVLTGVAVLGGAMAVALTLYAYDVRHPEPGSSRRKLAETSVASNNARPAVGPAHAPVEIVEYFDLQCPACRSAAPIVDAVISAPQFQGKIRFVFRHFPLVDIHPDALAAARAAECAFRQGKFLEMRSLLYAHQATLTPRDLQGNARQIGLGEKDFQTCLDGESSYTAVEADWREGLERDVSATPTYFLNGTRIEGVPTFAQLQQAITLELTKKFREP